MRLRGKKYLWTLFILMFLASMANVSIPVTSSPTVTFRVEPSITTGVTEGSPVGINVSIEAPQGTAVIAWGITIKVDPDVLKPGYTTDGWEFVAYTGVAGYFLYDWCVANGWDPEPGTNPTSLMVGEKDEAAGVINGTVESIKAWADLGVGVGADGTGTLVTFFFTSLNETAWSPIVITEAYYWTSLESPDEDKHPPDIIIPGNYNSPPGGDAAVTNVVPSFSEAYPMWTVQVNVTVLNNGTIPINCTVAAYYNASTWYEIGTQNVTNLPASESTTLTFNWTLAGVPYHNRTIKANATLIGLDDMNPSNNEFVVYDAVKVKMEGDVDGDGEVYMDDFVLFCGYYAMHSGDENWNRQCDFNDDSYVGSMDLFMLAVNYPTFSY